MDTKARQALAVAAIVVESVQAGGTLGVPGGTLYAALMAHGCTLSQFEGLMAQLVDAGCVSRSGDLYHVGPKGAALVRAMAA